MAEKAALKAEKGRKGMSKSRKVACLMALHD